MKKSKEAKEWPMLLDLTKEECKQTLRALELSTYSKIVSVLRAQGELTKEKRKLLSELQSVFCISVERHRAEIRRAVNDEVLNTVAETLAGPNTSIEWAIEGRRLVPLMPRVSPQVTYSALATRMAQLYCGINAQTPNPCETAAFGKFDDVGAELDMTDSEEETEGLRYITEDMIPQQYNADQGHYTTLPLSKARIAKEKLKEKETEAATESLKDEAALSPPLLSSSMSSGSNTSAGSHGVAPLLFSSGDSENRKRKRSSSDDHLPPHSPPPPPVPSSQILTAALGSGPNVQTSALLKQLPNTGSTLSGSSMKITVSGGITRSSSGAQVVTTGSTQQKVILVSTSAASGQPGSIYQRSISVPVLKTATHCTLAGASSIVGGQALQTPHSGVVKGIPTSVLSTSTSSASVTASVVSKLRPRFSSAIAPSIITQGSSCLPGLPSRPIQRTRSNSLILQTEGDTHINRTSSGPPLGLGLTAGLDTSSVPSTSVNFLGANTLQLRSGTSVAPKTNIQVKQEGGKIITHTIVASTAIGSTGHSTTVTASGGAGTPSIVSSRIIGRSGIPSSSQGLYVVSTSSGTGSITVVTRTVASASVSTPRVVTVNTINSSRSSVLRGPPPASVMSMGMTPKAIPTPTTQQSSIRPVATKSNLIVVHKGSISLRDLSAKIIAKGNSQVLPGNVGGGTSSGILSGTLLVRSSPSTSKLYTSVISNSGKDTSASAAVNSVSSSSSGSANNLIVVDLNSENAASAATQSVLKTPGTLAAAVKSSFASQPSSKLIADSPQITSARRDNNSAAQASCAHDISTVSASSSLPTSLRPPKSPLMTSAIDESLSEDRDETEQLLPHSELVSSSSDAKTEHSDDQGEDGENLVASLSMEEQGEMEEEEEVEEEEEDNEWLKCGLEDEEEIEMEEGEDERSSDLSSSTEKSGELMSEETVKEEEEEEEEMGKEEEEEEEEMGKEEQEEEEEMGKEEEEDVSAGPSKDVLNREMVKVTEEAAVTSSTGSGTNGELQMLVEKAVEVLQEGDSAQARTLLYKAGLELIESASDADQSEGENFSISNMAAVSSSSTMVCNTTPLSSSTPLRDESSLGSMSELDASTGYFYSPSAGENSSEAMSNRGDSPTQKDDDSLTVPEFADENMDDE